MSEKKVYLAGQVELAKLIHNYEAEKTQPYCSWFILRHVSGDGRGIHIKINDPHKWEVSLCWVHGRNGAFYGLMPGPSIKVSKSRGVEGLAKDIQKRLLPGYDEEFAEWLRKRDTDISDEDNLKLRRDKMLEALGETIPANDRTQLTVYKNEFVKHLTVNSSNYELTVKLPDDLAFELVEWLKNKEKQ